MAAEALSAPLNTYLNRYLIAWTAVGEQVYPRRGSLALARPQRAAGASGRRRQRGRRRSACGRGQGGWICRKRRGRSREHARCGRAPGHRLSELTPENITTVARSRGADNGTYEGDGHEGRSRFRAHPVPRAAVTSSSLLATTKLERSPRGGKRNDLDERMDELKKAFFEEFSLNKGAGEMHEHDEFDNSEGGRK